MALRDHLDTRVDFTTALIAVAALTFLGTLAVLPRVIRKLRAAKIIGRDINKPGRPEVAEMGGIAVFLGFNAGTFLLLFLSPLAPAQEMLILVCLITAAGAAMTGVIDDLVELRQRFKAFIPVVFAAPVALFAADYTIEFPFLGAVDFGLLYPLLLVPLGVTCAANSFNMLEGYNGLGAGVGLVSSVVLGILVWQNGHPEALALIVPLAAALAAFLVFNAYPAKVFPGDTMTLLVGATLAMAAMVGKVELWGALLFLPHIAEFVLKARGHFEAENFANEVTVDASGRTLLRHRGRVESLTHLVTRRGAKPEPAIAATFWVAQAALGAAVLLAAWIL